MKKIIISILAIFCAIAISSCEDDKATSTAPVLGEIILTPNPCSPGDSVTMTIPIKKEGENYYFYKAKYEIQGVDTINMEKNTLIYRNPLSLKFIAPTKPGRYNVKFSGSVSFTAGGQLYGDLNSVSTKLEVSEEPTAKN